MFITADCLEPIAYKTIEGRDHNIPENPHQRHESLQITQQTDLKHGAKRCLNCRDLERQGKRIELTEQISTDSIFRMEFLKIYD